MLKIKLQYDKIPGDKNPYAITLLTYVGNDPDPYRSIIAIRGIDRLSKRCRNEFITGLEVAFENQLREIQKEKGDILFISKSVEK